MHVENRSDHEEHEPTPPGLRDDAMMLWAQLMVKHRRTCMVVSVLLTLLSAACLPRLNFDIRPNSTFQAENKASRDLERLHTIFGPDDNDIVVMLTGDTLLEPNSLAAMRTLCDQIRDIPEVESVSSILNLNKPGRIVPLVPRYLTDSFDSNRLLVELREHPLAANQMVSDDGKVISLVARMRGDSLSVSSLSECIERIQERVDQFEATTSAQVHLAGHPAIRADVLVTIQRAMLVGCVAAIVIAFLVALLLFQRLTPVLAAVAAPAIGSCWTFGLIAWAGEPVGGLLSALPNLVFVVGLTDAVHLVLEYRRQLRIGGTQQDSVVKSLIHVGPACFLTSLTTFIGFGSLALSKTTSVQAFGIWAAIGTTLALFAVVFTLPAILLATPVTWMTDRRAKPDRLSSWIGKLVSPTLRHPGITTTVAIGLSLALLYPAFNQRPDIVWTEAIPDSSSSVIAMRQADESIGGALTAYAMITWPEGETFPSRRILKAASEAQSILKEAPEFHGDFSILNVLAAAPGRGLQDKTRVLQQRSRSSLGQMLDIDHRALLVSARVPNDGAFALNQRLRDVEGKLAQLAEASPGFDFSMTGTVVAASKNMNAIIVDLARSLAIASVLIFVVITIAFRSLAIGCLSIVPNVLPLLVMAAGLSLMGLPLQITAAVTFSLCLGLAVDDTIHVLTRFRSIQAGEPDTLTAMERTLSQVGPALVVTTLILLGGFAALMASPLPSIRLFSVLSGAILVTALIGDLILFPAMLVWGTRVFKRL